MTKETKALIQYRLERAQETLKEAEILLKQGLPTPMSTVSIMHAFMQSPLYC